jgi:hypothetical protein
LDQVAILRQLADERIDLLQAQRGLWLAFQITTYEAILGNTQFQRSRTGVVAGRAAVLFSQVENPLDAAQSSLRLALVNRFAERAGYQVPSIADWARSTSRGPDELFRDWQRTQTQSSVTALRARDSKWMSGPAGMQGPPAERQTCAVKNPDPSSARSPERAGGLAFFP